MAGSSSAEPGRPGGQVPPGRSRRPQVAVVAGLTAVAVVGGLVLASALGGDDDGTTTTAEPTPTAEQPVETPDEQPSVEEPAEPAEPTDAAPGAEACPAGSPEQREPQAFPSAPAATGAEGATSAVLATSCGEIAVELLPEQAPATVASFRFLADEGYFDGTGCHRLTTAGIYVLQCGDPTGTGTGGPGYTVPLENAPEDGVYPAGTLAMARAADPDSGGSQFFVVFDETLLPAPGYTVFGRVTEGLEVLERVASAGVEGGGSDGPPAVPVELESVTVG